MMFKKGDLVKVIATTCGAPRETKGMYGTVISAADGDNVVQFDVHVSGHRKWNYSNAELKLASSDSNEPLTSLPPTAPGMVASSTGGLRDNKGKPRLSLVPRQLEEGVAEVIWKSSVQGGGKYPLHNWRKGLPFTEVADSCLRHIKKWVDGEDFDAETGLHHLKHAACNLAFLLWYIVFRPNMDDRFKGDNK